MNNLTIYGTPASRAYRVLWMATELGLDFENVPTNFRTGEQKAPEYLAINPNGRVPAIVDDKVTMCESLSINLYLSKRYPGPLTPASLEEDALATQWSIWALTEVEPHTVAILLQKFVVPEDKRDPAVVSKAEATLVAPFKVLDDTLAGREWLVGDRFTVADLNVCGVVSTALRIGFDMAPYPHVAGWLDRCLARPAAKVAGEMRAAAA